MIDLPTSGEQVIYNPIMYARCFHRENTDGARDQCAIFLQHQSSDRLDVGFCADDRWRVAELVLRRRRQQLVTATVRW